MLDKPYRVHLVENQYKHWNIHITMCDFDDFSSCNIVFLVCRESLRNSLKFCFTIIGIIGWVIVFLMLIISKCNIAFSTFKCCLTGTLKDIKLTMTWQLQKSGIHKWFELFLKMSWTLTLCSEWNIFKGYMSGGKKTAEVSLQYSPVLINLKNAESWKKILWCNHPAC